MPKNVSTFTRKRSRWPQAYGLWNVCTVAEVMVAEVILAKSPIKGQQITLSEHVTTVGAYAAQYLFGSPSEPTRLGAEWLAIFWVEISGELPEK